METILVLITRKRMARWRSARESLGAAKSLGGNVGCRLDRQRRAGGSGQHCRLRRVEVLRRVRCGFLAGTLRHGRGGGGSDLQGGKSHGGRCTGNVAVESRAGGRGPSARWTRGHACNRYLGGNRQMSVTRWYYRQRMEAVLQRTQRPWFIGVDPAAVKHGKVRQARRRSKCGGDAR